MQKSEHENDDGTTMRTMGRRRDWILGRAAAS